MSWGNCVYGGDSSAVKEQLHTVLHIQASCAAFAAIRADGSVVTWGSARRGGDSSVVKDRFNTFRTFKHPSLRLLRFGRMDLW